MKRKMEVVGFLALAISSLSVSPVSRADAGASDSLVLSYPSVNGTYIAADSVNTELVDSASLSGDCTDQDRKRIEQLKSMGDQTEHNYSRHTIDDQANAVCKALGYERYESAELMEWKKEFLGIVVGGFPVAHPIYDDNGAILDFKMLDTNVSRRTETATHEGCTASIDVRTVIGQYSKLVCVHKIGEPSKAGLLIQSGDAP
jgi:hypothetical protein